MPTPPTARNALDKMGIDAFCAEVANGKPLRHIAKMVGCDIASISNWLAADPQRSARARDARKSSAWHWDEEAVSELRDAERTPEGVAIARELASHYRWRAKMINPDDYADRVDLKHSGVLGITPAPVDPANLSPEDREAMRRILLASQAAAKDNSRDD